ncbi:MAG: 4-hydroxy-tetrahydrodipicolinate reductase [Clostridia bacterium]|nr:4-hydroxy-tetrahydrodipicolinate reductase [Clostridia bacterium]
MKVIIHGINGKMGNTLKKLIVNDPEIEIVAGIDSFPGENTFPVFSSAQECTVEADAVIDFSHFSIVPKLIQYCVEAKLPVVVCTTGLTDEQYDLLEEAAKKIPVFRSANMSLGINVLTEAIKSIVPPLEENFNIEIIEKHHTKKVDSPSGTAFLLADTVNNTCKVKKDYVFGRHSKSDVCKMTDLGIHAVRGGTIPGEHTVIFAGSDEVIEIKHTALSKNIFAHGAIKAAKFIAKAEKGLYNMTDLLNKG